MPITKQENLAKLRIENPTIDILEVTYTCEYDNNEKLDLTITKVVKRFGWEFEGSGFNFSRRPFKRDIRFYKINNLDKFLRENGNIKTKKSGKAIPRKS